MSPSSVVLPALLLPASAVRASMSLRSFTGSFGLARFLGDDHLELQGSNANHVAIEEHRFLGDQFVVDHRAVAAVEIPYHQLGLGSDDHTVPAADGIALRTHVASFFATDQTLGGRDLYFLARVGTLENFEFHLHGPLSFAITWQTAIRESKRLKAK